MLIVTFLVAVATLEALTASNNESKTCRNPNYIVNKVLWLAIHRVYHNPHPSTPK